MNWLLIKLVALFVIFSVALKCKIKLTWALLLTILATVLMYGISLPECWMLLQTSTLSYETFSVVAVLYVVTILQLLMENAGKVFSIEEIYEKVWNEQSFSPENTVSVHIRRIREKIEINPKEPRYLKVVWGIGYKIEKI
jgi:hypothetical protein